MNITKEKIEKISEYDYKRLKMFAERAVAGDNASKIYYDIFAKSIKVKYDYDILDENGNIPTYDAVETVESKVESTPAVEDVQLTVVETKKTSKKKSSKKADDAIVDPQTEQ